MMLYEHVRGMGVVLFYNSGLNLCEGQTFYTKKEIHLTNLYQGAKQVIEFWESVSYFPQSVESHLEVTGHKAINSGKLFLIFASHSFGSFFIQRTPFMMHSFSNIRS